MTSSGSGSSCWHGNRTVSRQHSSGQQRRRPLPAEDHVCDVCALRYSEISIDEADRVIAGLAGEVRDAAYAIPVEARRRRPGPEWWSGVR